MFLKKKRSTGSLSFYQSEFSELGQKHFVSQDYDDDGITDLKDRYPKTPGPKESDMLTEQEYFERNGSKLTEILKTKVDVAEVNRAAKIDAKKLDKEIAEVQASSEISVAREVNDPNEISIDEFKAIDVITRNNLAGEGLEDFIQAVENKNSDAIKDLQILQKALKNDGKYKGKIDEDFGVGTKAGMNALISENAPAIKSYYETKQLLEENSTKFVSPKGTPVEKEVDKEIKY